MKPKPWLYFTFLTKLREPKSCKSLASLMVLRAILTCAILTFGIPMPSLAYEDVTSRIQTIWSSMRYNRLTGVTTYEVALTNTSDESIPTDILVVIESISEPSVTVANADGTTADGKPYFDYSGLVGDDRLDPGETSQAKTWTFHNPNRVRFSYELKILSGSSVAPNNPPVITSTPVTTATEDSVYTYDVEATDPDGDVMTCSLTTCPDGMTIVAATGLIEWMPTNDQVGDSNVVVQVDDGRGGTATQAFTITVANVNDPPVADDQSATTDEDTPVVIALTASDIDGDSLTYNIASSPSNGSLSGTPPSVTYTPNADYAGPDSFTFSVNDGTVDSNIATVTITVGPVNDPPTANDDAASTDEDTPLTINVLANDSDPDGDVLTVDSVSDPPNGSVVNNGTDVTYTPDPDFNGVDTFTYTASDGSLTDTATVTVTVNPVNEAPVADDQSVTTDEDTSVGITLTASDIDGDALTYAIVSGPSNGSLSGTPPTITYTPNADYAGPDSFTFSVNDGTVDSNVATVSITVGPVNDPPTANDDTASTDEDTPLTINMLANDSDPDGDPLVVNSVSDPANGSVVNNGADVTYTPDPDFHGVDTFTYTASDGSLTDTATVTVTVNPVNDAPVADDQSVVTDEDTPVVIALTASDVDGDALTYAIVGGPSNGSLSGTPPSVTYTPNTDYIGPDSFTFSANDGTVDSNIATITITVGPVNDPPTANDDSASTDEDTPVPINVLANDSDPDGDPLTVDSVSDPPNGTVVNNGTDVTYTPDPDFNGVDTFTYTASDGSLTDTATVTVTVNPVNDAPVADDQSVVTDEDTPVGITLAASDVDGDSLTYAIVSGPSNGSLSGTPPSVTYTPNADYTGPDTFTFSANDGTADSNIATVSITVGSVNDPPTANDDTVSTDEDTPVTINVLSNDSDPDGDPLVVDSVSDPANGSAVNNGADVTYTPDPDFNGVDTFTYTASDGSLTDTATVTVTVNPVNDAPVADDQSVTTDEDTPVGITLTASDMDGDVLTYAIVSSPSNGSLSGTPPSVTYTPNADFQGPDSFTFSVNDGTVDSNVATVSITVNPVNDPPTANDDPASTDEDTPVPINVLANDSDPDGDPLMVDSVSDPPNGSVVNNGTDVTYTPDPDFNGVDTFTYTASDGSLTDTATVTVTVNPVNDAPVADAQSVTTDEDTPVGITLTASDVDGDSLIYNIASSPSNGSLSGTPPSVTYTPNADFQGPDSFTFSVNDGTVDSNVATVSITVNPVNDPPTANDDPASTDEDTPVPINVLANDSDPDGDPLMVDSVSDPPNGSVVNNGTDVTYTPDPDFNGVDTFTYTASDGSLTDTATVTVTVNPVNDAPVADDQSVVTDEDTPVVIALTASDVDGDALTYAIVGGPSNGSLSGTPPTVTYTPNADYAGPDSFTFSVNDGTVDSNVATVSITVGPVNDPPTANDDTASTDEDTPVTINVLANDSDPDGDPLMVDSVSDPPNGSVVNNGTDVTYTPDPDFNGVDTFTYTASDGSLTDTATVTVTVNPVNEAPVADDQSVVTDEDTPVVIALTASDVDGDALTYAIVGGPSHGSLSGTPPTVTYTPNADYIGPDSFTFTANDGTVDSNIATVSITVGPVNDPPVITSTPITFTAEDVLYTYDVEATDPEGDILTYSLLVLPSGMTIDPSTGLIHWTPTGAHVGPNDVVVQVDDGNGGTAMQPFTIIVEEAPPQEDNLRPEVDVVVVPSVANTGDSVTITVNATDDEGVVSKALTVNGAPVSLDGSGTATYTSAEAGVFTAVGTALDAAGNEGLDSEEFRFLTPGDTTPPTVAITSPADRSKISVPTDIIGTASDPNLTLYRLEYSVKDKNEFITFASDRSSVTADVLGTLDPTMMRNGLYDVRLTAEDESGNTASVTRTYQLEGQMKIGNFTISFNDLTIPVTGIPTTIVRTYDSRDKRKGDFGIGWTLSIKDVELSESCVMGEHWQQVVRYDGWWQYYYLEPTKPHYVTVTYPDGRTDEFEMVVNPSVSDAFMGRIQWTTASFNPKPGTFSSLVSLDYNDLYVSGALGPVELLDGSDFTIYNPNRYQLTAMDGTVFVIDQETGLESVTDTNGNTIFITRDGIIHSAGKSVTFTRDAQDRITTITDPMGNTIDYEYDYYGDLVSVTDQEGNVTQLAYNSNHGLLDIIDPRGITPVRNEYDDEGRLIATVDADGNRVEFTHNIGTRQEVVRDRLGNVTVYEYDDDGNVVSQTDALGNTISSTYDPRGNKLSEADPLGNTRTYIYDAQDNILSETDALGNTTAYTYNSRGQVATAADREGNVTTNTFDANGNLTSTMDSLGNVTSFSSDAGGNVTGEADPLGNVTTYTYDAVGNIVSTTDPLGNMTAYTYDANGNKVSETKTRTTPSGVETIIMSYVYNRQNLLVQTIDPYGNTTSIEYNVLGKKAAHIDELGNRTEYEYDARGNLTRVIYPDGTEERYAYDAEDRKLTSTDRAGRTTSYTYDAGGNLTRTTYPDGTFTETEYDAAGRVTREIDERGNATRYTYDGAGRRTSVIDALGNTTAYEYDKNGRQIRMTDANGNVTQYEYDANGRRIRTVFADGTSASTAYDAAGRKISETNQAGNTIQYEYDALGRLIRVTDALGNVTSYAYDEVGNLIFQTDANGNMTSFEYDKLGRQTKRVLPLGMAETTVYDAAGNVTSQTDFNGDTITFEYDVNNRLIRKNLPGGTSETYTHTATGRRQTVTDSRGVTSYEYGLRDRLVRRTDPDGRSISYAYDAAGNRISVTIPAGTTTYTYDPLNRLIAVADPDGGLTAYTYDAVGNRTSVSYRNGTVAEYTYDSLSRLTYLLNRKSTGEIISSYAYTLGPAGNRILVVEDTGRTVDYTYDVTYKLIQESINDPVSGLRVIGYTYDPVGNRLTKTDNGVTTMYSYDANDRLLTENGNIYVHDNNGNTLRKFGADDVTYSYDPLNRLIQANITDASGSSVVRYAYDVDGIRVQKTVDGTDVSNYLLDRNRQFTQVLLETNAWGVPIVSYVYGDDLISQCRGGAVAYYHYDGQMSTRNLTDAVETVTDTYVYDAFGILLDQTGTTENNYLYTGEQYDPNIGFYYLRARYSNPGIGRFLTQDPFPGNIFDPVTLHRYLYANADPVNNLDPSGELTGWIRFFVRFRLMAEIAVRGISYVKEVLMDTLGGLVGTYNKNVILTGYDVIKIALYKLGPAHKMREIAILAIASGQGQWAYTLEVNARMLIAHIYTEIAQTIAGGYIKWIFTPILDIWDKVIKTVQTRIELHRVGRFFSLAKEVYELQDDLKNYSDKLRELWTTSCDLFQLCSEIDKLADRIGNSVSLLPIMP